MLWLRTASLALIPSSVHVVIQHLSTVRSLYLGIACLNSVQTDQVLPNAWVLHGLLRWGDPSSSLYGSYQHVRLKGKRCDSDMSSVSRVKYRSTRMYQLASARQFLIRIVSSRGCRDLRVIQHTFLGHVVEIALVIAGHRFCHTVQPGQTSSLLLTFKFFYMKWLS